LFFTLSRQQDAELDDDDKVFASGIEHNGIVRFSNPPFEISVREENAALARTEQARAAEKIWHTIIFSRFQKIIKMRCPPQAFRIFMYLLILPLPPPSSNVT
jgi:hypothetical protein